jgi:hypothetical protein
MTRYFWLTLVISAAVCAGCLSIGGTAPSLTVSVPTVAQELTELKQGLASGKLTPDEFEVAKTAVLHRAANGPSSADAVKWASHDKAH